MTPIPLLSISVFALLALGVWSVRHRAAWRSRDLQWTPEQSRKLDEMYELIERVGYFGNVDPWGELAVAHEKKMSGQFKQFLAAIGPRFRKAPEAHQEIRTAGAAAYLAFMSRLGQTARLLQELEIADPSYYRSIIHTAEDDANPQEIDDAKAELRAQNLLEEMIRSSLIDSEKALVDFDQVTNSLVNGRGEISRTEYEAMLAKLAGIGAVSPFGK